MNKKQRKTLLIARELVSGDHKPIIIRRGPNEQHNEITVAIMHYAMPTNNLIPDVPPSILKKVGEMAKSRKKIKLTFNNNPEAPAFLFTCKGRTERRGDDEPNQELADRIAIAKCNRAAYMVGKQITRLILDVIAEETSNLLDVYSFLQDKIKKEESYIRKI